jgi:hypothetical protein
MADKMGLEAKIKHFLKLAEDPGATQDERDLASAQAERLMLKHGIDEAMLPGDERPAEQIVKETIFFGGAYARERAEMFFRLVRAVKLRGYHTGVGVRDRDILSGKIVNGDRCTVVGYEGDVKSFMELMRSLDVQAAVGLKAWNKSHEWNYWEDNAAKQLARKSWLYGFGVGAGQRIEESRRVIINEAPTGTAVALIDREREVADWLRANMKLSSGRGRRRTINGSASASGRSAGYSSNTGSKGLSGGRLALSR